MKKKIKLFNLIWLMLAGIIIVVDQGTKYLVLTHLEPYQAIRVTSFFNILLSFNTGSAFGFLNDASGWQKWLLGSISGIVSAILVVAILRQPREQWLTTMSLSFILGGALGNLVDRVTQGFVTDFFHFHINHWSWPIFNVADTMICIGAGLLVLGMFFASNDLSNDKSKNS